MLAGWLKVHQPLTPPTNLEPETFVIPSTGVTGSKWVLISGLWVELVSNGNSLTSVSDTVSPGVWEAAGEAAVSHRADQPLRTFLRSPVCTGQTWLQPTPSAFWLDLDRRGWMVGFGWTDGQTTITPKQLTTLFLSPNCNELPQYAVCAGDTAEKSPPVPRPCGEIDNQLQTSN